MHYSKIAAGLDKKGNITAWFHRLIGESIAASTPFKNLLIHEGIDHLSIEGADHPYAFIVFLLAAFLMGVITPIYLR